MSHDYVGWNDGERDGAELRRFIRRTGLVGLMNAPKWRRLIHALKPFDLSYRVKLIDDDETSPWITDIWVASPSYIDMESVGPVRSLQIEWIDIQPAAELNMHGRRESLEQLASVLASLNVPFQWSDAETLRVLGYLVPSS